jgi:enterochelin esterase family protein
MFDPISAFARLRAQVAAVPAHQQALVDAFVAAYPVSPLVYGDHAIIYYTGQAASVVVRGDMLHERSQPLARLGQTSLWWYSGQYEPDARLDYHLLVDGVDLGDPRNQRQVPSGYGPRADLRMPQYIDPEIWRPRSGVSAGSMETFADFQGACYPTTRTVWVYTPAGYDPQRRYPSVYFHDGGDYLSFASAPTIFDNLIATGVLPPCIAVFINPSNEHGRVVDYDLNRDYCRLLAEELVPWVDARYATERTSTRRANIGASFGGLIALFAANLHPDIFGLAGSQSGFVGRSNATIMDLYRRPPSLPIAVHLIVGTYETEIGGDRLGRAEADFLQANRAFYNVLKQQRYRCAYAEYHEGHSWGLWRVRLGDALAFLLSP